jgi:hypothetical protein
MPKTTRKQRPASLSTLIQNLITLQNIRRGLTALEARAKAKSRVRTAVITAFFVTAAFCFGRPSAFADYEAYETPAVTEAGTVEYTPTDDASPAPAEEVPTGDISGMDEGVLSEPAAEESPNPVTETPETETPGVETPGTETPVSEGTEAPTTLTDPAEAMKQAEIERLKAHIDAMEARIDVLMEAVARAEAELKPIEEKIAELEGWITALLAAFNINQNLTDQQRMEIMGNVSRFIAEKNMLVLKRNELRMYINAKNAEIDGYEGQIVDARQRLKELTGSTSTGN